MPAPTFTYKVITSKEQFTPDVDELNDLTGQGWDLVETHQIAGGPDKARFWFLMRRTVTMKEESG